MLTYNTYECLGCSWSVQRPSSTPISFDLSLTRLLESNRISLAVLPTKQSWLKSCICVLLSIISLATYARSRSLRERTGLRPKCRRPTKQLTLFIRNKWTKRGDLLFLAASQFPGLNYFSMQNSETPHLLKVVLIIAMTCSRGRVVGTHSSARRFFRRPIHSEEF